MTQSRLASWRDADARARSDELLAVKSELVVKKREVAIASLSSVSDMPFHEN